MATVDIATLQAKLVADTRQFTSQLKAAESKMAGLTRSLDKHSKQQQRQNQKTSHSFRGVAIAAGAAAVAYAGVAKGKAAVATTTELAKATMGLSKTLGLSTREASAWAAVARSRSIDNRTLQMSFATLSRQVLTAQQGSKSARQMFTSLGISQRDLARGSKDVTYLLGRVADGMGRLGPGAAKAATMSKLLGRGWRDMGPILREGSAAMQQQLGLAEKYGLVMGENQVNQIMKLVAAQRELKMATMGLQLAFAQAATPILQQWSGLIAQLLNQARNGDIGGAIGEALSRGVTMAVSHIGQMAPRVAQAFVQGFVQAPILGQFLIGAWLTRRLGLWPAMFAAQGGKGGAGFVKGFLGKVTLIGAAGLLIADLWKKTSGHGFAMKGYADQIAKATQGQLATLRGAVAAEERLKTLNQGEVAAIRAAITARQTELNVMRQQANIAKGKTLGWDIAKELLGQRGKVKGAVAQLAKELDHLPQKSQAAGIKTALELAAKMEREGSVPKNTAKRLAMHMAKNLDKLTPAAARTVKNVATAFGFGFAGMDAEVQKALKSTVDATNRAGQALGVKKPVTFSVKAYKTSGTVAAGVEKKQQGGVIGGTGRQDSQLIKAAPGEVVLTRHQQAMVNMGASVPEALRNRRRHAAPPQFAKGGRVVRGPVTWFGGPTDPMAGDTTASGQSVNVPGIAIYDRSTLGKMWGVTVGSRGPLDLPQTDIGPAPWTGNKIDVTVGAVPKFGYTTANFPSGTTGTAVLGGGGAGALSDIPRLMLNGPPGGARGVGQAAISKTYDAAKSYLAAQEKTVGFGGGGAGAIPSGSIAGLQPKIAGIASELMKRFGLGLSSGLRPGSITKSGNVSWHASGHAADLSNGVNTPEMMDAAKYAWSNWGSQLKELFYDPWGGADNGVRIGAIGGHSDHVHIAAQRGQKVKPASEGTPKPIVNSSLQSKERKDREKALERLKQRRSKGLKAKGKTPALFRNLRLDSPDTIMSGWERVTSVLWDQVNTRYGNMEKTFNLSEEQFLVPMGDGDVVDQNAIGQRVQELLALREYQTGDIGRALSDQSLAGDATDLWLTNSMERAKELIALAEKTIEREKARQDRWRSLIKRNQQKITSLRKRKKKPRGWQEQIGLWQHEIGIFGQNIDRSQALIGRMQERRSDASAAIGSYVTTRGGLTDARFMDIGDSLPQRRVEQGLLVSSLDAELASVRGTRATPSGVGSIDAGGGSDASDNLQAELDRARERARIAERTAALSESTLRVFKGDFAGTFHTGGVIGGTGEKVAHVQGGEGIFTRDQMAAMGGDGGAANVVVNIHGDAGVGALIQAVDVIVDGKVFSPSPKNQRRLADSVVAGMGYQGSRISPRQQVTA